MTEQPTPTHHSNPPGLLNLPACMEAVWPDPQSRPSERWMRRMIALRKIPFVRIGRMLWFEPARVHAALRKFEVGVL